MLFDLFGVLPSEVSISLLEKTTLLCLKTPKTSGCEARLPEANGGTLGLPSALGVCFGRRTDLPRQDILEAKLTLARPE